MKGIFRLVCVLLAVSGNLAYAGLILTPAGGSFGGIGVDVDNLGGHTVTGFDLRLDWNLGVDEVEVDFWTTEYGVALGPDSAGVTTDIEARSFACRGSGFSPVCSSRRAHGDSGFFRFSVRALDDDALVRSSVDTYLDAMSGRMNLLSLILASNSAVGPLLPENLRLSGAVYGEGWRVVFAVAEPAIVGLTAVAVAILLCFTRPSRRRHGRFMRRGF